MKNLCCIVFICSFSFLSFSQIPNADSINNNLNPASYRIQVDAGWNLISLPLKVAEAKHILFPAAVSAAQATVYLDFLGLWLSKRYTRGLAI